MIRILFGIAAAFTCWGPSAWCDDRAKPLYGTWGFDTAAMDRSTKPGDDFFRYANGRWLDEHEIGADQSGVHALLEIRIRTEERIHAILERVAAVAGHEPASLDGKVGAFYKSFMDEARVEALGATPLQHELDLIRATGSNAQIASLMGRSSVGFFGTLFRLRILADAKDPQRYSVQIIQAGLGLPDRDYYLNPNFATQRTAYERYVATLLKLVDWPDPEARAQDVVAFETRVAEVSWTRTQQRDRLATYNPMSVDELTHFAPGFAWNEYLASANLPPLDRVVVSEKSAFPKLAAVFSETPLETLQAYLAFTVADNAASYLSTPFTDAVFAMRDKALQGQADQQVRWKRGVRAVSGGDYIFSGDRRDGPNNMSWGVGQLYTAEYFPPSAKAAIADLVANLTVAYSERIKRLGWLSAETKREALKKLETYTVKIGYPDTWRDYSGLVIRDDDLIGNVRRSAAANWAHYLGELPHPVDRGEWYLSPQTVNAMNGLLLDIIFPAAILQAPIFDANADAAVNYGAIGAIIGHELTHGFDDQGRKTDAEGTLRDWWQPEDAKRFDIRAAKLGDQYSSFAPLPGVHVNGALTMGENIADLGGLTLALAAYRASLQGKPAPIIDGFTGDQRVFLGWAQEWHGKLREDTLRKRLVSDPHSPYPYRVNGPVRNIEDWYTAFGVKPGDALYLAPKDRAQIW